MFAALSSSGQSWMFADPRRLSDRMTSASSLVDKATSDLLIGPDWAMNLDICDVINGDPGQAKDVVKAIKRRLNNKNARVQLLALNVLETLIKNCGEILHQQVAEKDVLHEMTKIVKKKSDMQVRDKILVLLDSWQEAFGGSRGRYPQYYMAFEELRRSGVEFPDRAPEHNVPIFTPPQSHSVSQPHGYSSPTAWYTSPRVEAVMAAETQSMSLTDIEAARSGVEVLSEMLNAINPTDKEAVVDEVIMDLVDQSRANQRRVMQLVNISLNEEVLLQGLSLNDYLQRVLAKHDAIASGLPLPRDQSMPAGQQFDGEEGSEDDLAQWSYRPLSRNRSAAHGAVQNRSATQLTLPPPPPPKMLHVAPSQREMTVDLLSGDNYEDDVPPVHTSVSHIQPVVASPLSLPVSSNPFDSDSAFQALPAPSDLQPLYSPPVQQQQSQQYPYTNGLNSPTSAPNQYAYQGYVQQQFQQDQIAQGQGVQNCIVPWAAPNLSLLKTSMYGQLPVSPQQQAQLQSYPVSVPWGGQNTPSFSHQQYLEQQQVGQQHMNPQQHAMLYGNVSSPVVPVLPPPPVQHSQRQQFFQQQQQKSYHASGSYVVGQTQNLSLQDLGCKSSQEQHIGGRPLQQAPNPQKQPVKEASAADMLFEDLVDLSNQNPRFKTAGILSRGPSKSSSFASNTN